jgi:WD40 repeat protein
LHDGNPVPKVIDFGIAKATHQKLTEKTLFTNYAQMIGTPAYMSPEQAEMSGLDIDTRTDVYSLGVVLYELLTGTTPFPAQELLSAGYAEMQRIIAEKEPPKPSTRLTTMQDEERTGVANNRNVEAKTLGRLFQGDLDWMVMKALEKHRTRRYETANGLAMDIKRHLNNEPISAAAPALRYQLSKFARRNQRYMRMAACVAGLLALALLFSSYQAVRATRARMAAELARRQAQASYAQARDAQASETKLRRQADAQAQAARQRAYDSDFHRPSDPGMAFAHRSALLAYTDPVSPSNSILYVFDLKAQKVVSHEMFPTPRMVAFQAFTPDDRVLISVHLLAKSGATRFINPRYAVHLEPGEPDGLLTANDAATGRFLWRKAVNLPSQPFGRVRLDVSPDGQEVALPVVTSPNSAEKAGVRVFDIKDGKERLRIDTGGEAPRAVLFSRDGSALLTSARSADSVIRIWDAHDGRVLGTLDAHQSYVTDLAFTPDGRTLISAGGDYTIHLWDWAERRPAGVLRGHLDAVNGLAVSPDGKSLASSCDDGSICLWDLERIQAHTGLRTFTISSPPQPALPGDTAAYKTTYAFTTDGASIIKKPYTGGRVVTWDTSSLRPFESPAATGSFSAFVALSPDRGEVVRRDGELYPGMKTENFKVLNVRSGRGIASLSGSVAQEPAGGQWMTFTRDGKKLILCQRSEQKTGVFASFCILRNFLFDIWDTDTWQHRHFEHRAPAYYNGSIVSKGQGWFGERGYILENRDVLESLPLPNLIAMVGWSEINILDVARPEQPPGTIQLRPGIGPFYAFAASPDGSTAATVSGGMEFLWSGTGRRSN